MPVYSVFCVLNALQNERNTECFTLQHTTNYRRVKAATSFTSPGSKNKREPGSGSLRPRRIKCLQIRLGSRNFLWKILPDNLYFKQLMITCIYLQKLNIRCFDVEMKACVSYAYCDFFYCYTGLVFSEFPPSGLNTTIVNKCYENLVI